MTSVYLKIRKSPYALWEKVKGGWSWCNGQRHHGRDSPSRELVFHLSFSPKEAIERGQGATSESSIWVRGCLAWTQNVTGHSMFSLNVSRNHPYSIMAFTHSISIGEERKIHCKTILYFTSGLKKLARICHFPIVFFGSKVSTLSDYSSVYQPWGQGVHLRPVKYRAWV